MWFFLKLKVAISAKFEYGIYEINLQKYINNIKLIFTNNHYKEVYLFNNVSIHSFVQLLAFKMYFSKEIHLK